MKVEAVQCDACDHLDVTPEGSSTPEGWLLVDIDQYEAHVVNGAMYCSWACLAEVAQHRTATPRKRKRRTRAEMEADAGAALTIAARQEGEALERSLGVPDA